MNFPCPRSHLRSCLREAGSALPVCNIHQGEPIPSTARAVTPHRVTVDKKDASAPYSQPHYFVYCAYAMKMGCYLPL